MTIVCPVSQIVDLNFHESGEFRPVEDTMIEGAGEKFRKNRDDVKPHGRLNLQQPFRHVNANGPLGQIHIAQRLSERDQHVTPIYDYFHQQRPAVLLPSCHDAEEIAAGAIQYRAANEIGLKEAAIR